MEPKKKMGRPSTGRVWRRYTLSKDVAEFIDSLPNGDRSKFVDVSLARVIEEYKAINPVKDPMKGVSDYE